MSAKNQNILHGLILVKSPYVCKILSTQKFVRLNNVIREQPLTLFEKQLAYLIQTDRGAVLKLSSFFLFRYILIQSCCIVFTSMYA